MPDKDKFVVINISQGESDMAERGREEEPLIIFLTISVLGRAVATAIAGRSREPVPR